MKNVLVRASALHDPRSYRGTVAIWHVASCCFFYYRYLPLSRL